MPKIISKTLPIPLTDEEKIVYGQNNAHAVEALAELEAAQKAAAETHKRKITLAKTEIAKLSHIVASGIEWRDIDCEVLMNFERGEVTTTRCDTGAVIEVRRMTMDEQQMELEALV